jgi:hypothetical protein
MPLGLPMSARSGLFGCTAPNFSGDKYYRHSERFCTGDNSVPGHDANWWPSVCSGPREVYVERFVHNANIALYRRLISESELHPSRDEKRHAMLLTLLAEEEAREQSKQPEEQSIAFAPSFFRP